MRSRALEFDTGLKLGAGKLEMPSCVASRKAHAQRRPTSCQPEVSRVVIERLKIERLDRPDAKRRRKCLEPGYLGALLENKFAFHLDQWSHHRLPGDSEVPLVGALGLIHIRRRRREDILKGVETWDAIRARRNVRTYEDRAISPEHLERILEAGWRSPSAMNRQPWDFVLVTDPSQLQELSTVWTGAHHLASAKAAVVLLLELPENERVGTIDQYDLGQATMAMMLAAADLGIGSGHSAIGDQEACRRIIASPANRICAYMLALGYPADRPLKPIVSPNRRPFDEVVHRARW